MIDVGQGDSILLEFPHNNHVVLVDTGGKMEYKKEEWKQYNKENYSDYNVIPYLKSIGISKIDQLILTHGDIDHIGESLNVLKRFSVAHIIMNSYANTEIEDTIEQRYNNVIKVNKKMIVKIGEHRLEIVSIPNKEENQNSLILILHVYNKKVLLTSDITKEEEKILLNTYNLEKVDILKVAHHGSNTSSSQIFINRTRPKYSILQVGEKNRFGHPHIEVLERLSQLHSTTLDTRTTGSIQFVWNKNRFKWIVCNS